MKSFISFSFALATIASAAGNNYFDVVDYPSNGIESNIMAFPNVANAGYYPSLPTNLNQVAPHPGFSNAQEVMEFLAYNNLNGLTNLPSSSNVGNGMAFPAEVLDYPMMPQSDEEVADFLRFGAAFRNRRVRQQGYFRNDDCMYPEDYYGYAPAPSSLPVANPGQLTPPPAGSAEGRSRARRPVAAGRPVPAGRRRN